MSSLLMFNRVYRQEIQSFMLVSTRLYPSNLLSCSPPPSSPLPKVKVHYKLILCDWEGVGGV
jgi:hypothetical protein